MERNAMPSKFALENRVTPGRGCSGATAPKRKKKIDI